MVRTKITYTTMGITSSPNQGYYLKRATSYDTLSSSLDLNHRYSCASSQASTQEAFEENNLYRLDFTCPYCTNPLYITGEHFGDKRYIVTYDFDQNTDHEYTTSVDNTPSLIKEEYPPVDKQEAPLPSPSVMKQKVFRTPPTKTSAEMFSEYSKNPRSNIKIAQQHVRKPKRSLFDKYVDEHHDNDNEKTICHEKEEVTQRFPKRIKKTPRRYIEAA